MEYGLNAFVNPRKVKKAHINKSNETPIITKFIEQKKTVIPDAKLLINRRRAHSISPVKHITPELKLDDNLTLLNLIKKRMKVGATRYGHGLRVKDDTRMYGTEEDSWCEMGLEEMLDGIVYMAASIVRNERKRGYDRNMVNDDIVYDPYRSRLYDPYQKHKKVLF